MKSSAVPLGIALGIAALPAQAQDKPSKTECLDAHEAAQQLERDGKLLEARSSYQVCSNAACPALVRSECEPRIAALASDVPSVRVTASGSGDVTVDGKPLPAAGADGTIELDPGEHVFEQGAASARLVLEKGQRGAEVRLEPPPARSPSTPLPAAEEPAAEPKRGPPVAVWVLGGVAVVGVAGFVGFGLSGRSQQSDLDDCKPNCSQGDVDDMKRSYLFADIALGLAAVAGGAAAYLYFTADDRPEREGGAFVGVRPSARGAALTAGLNF